MGKRSDFREKLLYFKVKILIFYDSTAQLDDILEARRYSTILLFVLAEDIQFNKLNNVEEHSAFVEHMRRESFIKVTTKKMKSNHHPISDLCFSKSALGGNPNVAWEQEQTRY